MHRISVIGLFCTGRDTADGQSIKTRIITEELQSKRNGSAIHQIDTYLWKRHPLRLLLKSIWAVWRSKHVVFMVDEGGIKVFPWLLTVANFFSCSKIHYIVIGGWLPESLKTRPLRKFWLKKLYGIYVETQTMKSAMENLGFTNVILMPNCKRLSLISESELMITTKAPFRLCTFSRVMKEKGIDDAVKAVNAVNQRFGKPVYTLDIYGMVDPAQQDWFEKLQTEFTECIHYQGVIPYHQSISVLKGYFALLFPTKLFYIEGVPGTIIDSFAAGVPVIASRWLNCSDIIDSDTSIIYPASSFDALVDILETVASTPDLINSKRVACLQRAQLYTPEHVMHVLLDQLD